jgi:hypothetical protein
MPFKRAEHGVPYAKTITCGRRNVSRQESKRQLRQSKYPSSILIIKSFSLARKQYWEMSAQNIINEGQEEEHSQVVEPSGKLTSNREPEPNTGGACHRRAHWKSVYLR